MPGRAYFVHSPSRNVERDDEEAERRRVADEVAVQPRNAGDRHLGVQTLLLTVEAGHRQERMAFAHVEVEQLGGALVDEHLFRSGGVSTVQQQRSPEEARAAAGLSDVREAERSRRHRIGRHHHELALLVPGDIGVVVERGDQIGHTLFVRLAGRVRRVVADERRQVGEIAGRRKALGGGSRPPSTGDECHRRARSECDEQRHDDERQPATGGGRRAPTAMPPASARTLPVTHGACRSTPLSSPTGRVPSRLAGCSWHPHDDAG